MGKKGANEVRRSLDSRSFESERICGQYGTQTQECYRENYREEQNKGEYSTEDKRKMAREENAWTFPS
jgi:hypothetical protein